MFAVAAVLLDFPSSCFNDQVLGRWQVNVTDFDVRPANDQALCPASLATSKSKVIRLISPNLAIDEAGFSGTWTIIYNQALEVKVGGYVYSWYVDWKRDEKDQKMIVTNCSRSMPTQGWAVPEGVSRPLHACVRAQNLEPDLGMNRTINYNGQPDPGPVNPNDTAPATSIEVDGRVYPLLPRKFQKRVPYGPSYRRTNATRRPVFGSVEYNGDYLPPNFDWRNVNGSSYVPPVFDQRSCGSCYACAASYMMMSRVMVQNKTPGFFTKANLFSVQHLVDCNQYSQGCSGGFAEHVGKFAENFGVLDVPGYGDYKGVDGKCHGGEFLKGTRYFFQNTLNLGGYTGAVTDAAEIQWELYRHGPIAVSIMVDGVYFGKLDPWGFDNSMNHTNSSHPDRHYYFDEANHGVLLVGWETKEVTHDGKLQNVTFWIIQNSWGENWGNVEADGKRHGTMRIAMGVNAYAIESEPVVTYWRKEGPAKYGDAPLAAPAPAAAQAATIALAVVCAVLAAAVVVLAALWARGRKAPAADRSEVEVLVE